MNVAEEEGILQPYSAFSKRQKRWIVFLAAFAGWFSTLSSFIFFPAIPTIATSLGASVEEINLTVTSYLLVSSAVPSIVGNAADIFGRRPVYIVILAIYFSANIGLAIQSSFPALFVLRMIQAAGVSGTFSVAYGVIADLSVPSDRGSYVGVVAFGTNTAPSIGPLLGAVLTAFGGWQWTFWFLAIISGSCWLAIVFTFPETARSITGNGTGDASAMYKAPFKPMQPSAGHPTAASVPKRQFRFPNPLSSLFILFKPDSLIIICSIAILYMVYSCLQISLSTLMVSLYSLTETQAGLIYLPFGLGCALSAVLTGKLLDYDYRYTAIEHGFPLSRLQQDHTIDLPIEKARLRRVFLILGVAIISITGYGWCLKYNVHIALPLTLQFLTGSMLQSCFTALNTLLVDLNSQRPATAQAACNLLRCILAAGGIAVVDVMTSRIGPGFSFTVFSIACFPIELMLLLEVRKGPEWRKSKTHQHNQSIGFRGLRDNSSNSNTLFTAARHFASPSCKNKDISSTQP